MDPPSYDTPSMDIIKLNVGGTSYCIPPFRLRRYPTSLLGRFANMDHASRLCVAHAFLADTQQYFFDRSPTVFQAIDQFYREDVMHVPSGVCASTFTNELQFWQIARRRVATCCDERLPHYFEEFQKLEEMEDPFAFSSTRPTRARRYLHKLFSDREYWGNTLYSVVVLTFVFVSLVIFALSTIPRMQQASLYNGYNIILPVEDLGEQAEEDNSTILSEVADEFHLSNLEIQASRFLHHANTAVIVFFTLEFLVRFWAAPGRIRFLRQPLNVCDLVSTLPFYVELLLQQLSNSGNGVALDHHSRLINVIRVLRLLRILRILRLSRYSIGMQSVALTLQRSYNAFATLGVFVMVVVLIYSFLILVVESDDPATPIRSLPQAMYWCLVTLTTVGYGDVVPITAAGKFTSCVVAVTGGLFLAFPVSIVVSTFLRSYQELTERALLKERQRILRSANGIGCGKLPASVTRNNGTAADEDKKNGGKYWLPSSRNVLSVCCVDIDRAAMQIRGSSKAWKKLRSIAPVKSSGVLRF